MRKILFAVAICIAVIAQAETFSVKVVNPIKVDREAVPVVVSLKDHGDIRSAVVTAKDGTEIPSQIDDLDGDGVADELVFLTDIEAKGKAAFTITTMAEGIAKAYESQVYAEMLMSNKKVKATNKQDLYISSLTVENGTNPYWMLHHHGPAFENKLVAYRIYFDHRQTVDIYGKYKEGLELKETQFYPDKEQKATGYGDDILWVGETFGLGTLRGWNGSQPTMIKDVNHRTLRIIAKGPLRTIVEVIDEGWLPEGGKERIDMTTTYTLYAGHRDCEVHVTFNRVPSEYQFATGIINVKNSVEYSDGTGLRGCWGTDWPVSEKDSAGHKRETVGLAICLAKDNIVQEQPANTDNYPFVIATGATDIHYYISFASDNETFGMHSADAWFEHLKAWKRDLENPVSISAL